MAAIRPIVTDFSMGEISPKLSGRVDLPLYTKGAAEMTNIIPWELGGAGKRGGLELKSVLGGDSVKVRIIPWSISNEIDILLVAFADGNVKLFDVSGDMDPVFIKDQNNDDVLIATRITEASLYEIKYAQNRNQIVLVHHSMPPFFIKVEHSAGDGETVFSVSYGDISFDGNVAATQFVEKETGNFKDISYADIIFAIEPLVSKTTALSENISCTEAEGLDAYFVFNGVRRKVTGMGAGRTTTVPKVETFFGNPGPSGTYYQDTSGTVNTAIPFSDKKVGDHIKQESYYANAYEQMKGWLSEHFKLEGHITTIPDGMTWFDAIPWFDSHLESGKQYLITNNSTDWQYPCGNHTSLKYTRGKKKITVTFEVEGMDDITISTDNMSGTFLGYIVDPKNKIEINGYSGTVVDMIDRLAPWMIDGKIYRCDESMKIGDMTPTSAVKQMDVINHEPVILINATSVSDVNGTQVATNSTITLSRRTPARLTGQIGIKLAPFQARGEYPSVAAFYQGRLCLGGSLNEPNILYMSKVNDNFNFCVFEELEYIQTAMKAKPWIDENVPEYETKTNTTQQIGAASAILLIIATEENEAIQSLVAHDDLFIGTATSEFVFPSGLTALNPRVSLVSRYGSSTLQARFVKDSVMFSTSSRKKVRYFGSPGYDLMKYADHIAEKRIVSIDFRQDPNTEIFAVLEDGTAILGTLNDSGVAWCKIKTSADGFLESVISIRADQEDAIYFVVKRTLPGGVSRTLERMKTTDDFLFQERIYLDCASVVTNASSFSSSLLYGKTVAVRFLRASDGKEFSGTATVGAGNVTQYVDSVTGTTITIPAFSVLVYGLLYEAALETFRIDNTETEGIPKQGVAAFFRCYKTGVFDLVRNNERFPIEPPDTEGVQRFPYTGTIRFENFAPWNTDQSIRLESNNSEPFGIQVILPQFQIGDAI